MSTTKKIKDAANQGPTDGDEYCLTTISIPWLMSSYDLTVDEARAFLRTHESDIIEAMMNAGQDRIEAIAHCYGIPSWNALDDDDDFATVEDVPSWDDFDDPSKLTP